MVSFYPVLCLRTLVRGQPHASSMNAEQREVVSVTEGRLGGDPCPVRGEMITGDQEGCRQSSEFKEMYSSIKRKK